MTNGSIKRGALLTGIGRAGRSVLAVAVLALGGAGLRGPTSSAPGRARPPHLLRGLDGCLVDKQRRRL